MLRKIKARCEAIKKDPYQRGVVLGGVCGATIALTAAVALRANFDDRGMYVPDSVIDQIRENGFAVGVKDGTRIAFAIVPELE